MRNEHARTLSIRSRRALVWSGADSFIRASLNLAITITLARLITPEEFGVLAMVLIFTAVAGVIADFGIASALIQKRDATVEDESTAFYFNIGAAVLAAFVLSACAPLIADFFRQPILADVVPVLSIGLVASSFGAVQSTLLRKVLNFRPAVWIGLGSTLLSGGLAIGLAAAGFGVWSLVWQSVAASVIGSALYWRVSAWRPVLCFRMQSLRSLLSFGGFMTVANLLNAAYGHLHAMVIGRIYGAIDAGFYARAHSTQLFPASFLSGVVNRVAFPAFSEVSDNPTRMRRGLANAMRALMLVNVPVCVGMSLVAEPLVLLAFGEAWLPSASLLQILCLASVLWPLQVLNVNALMAQGLSRQLLQIEVVKKSFGVALLLLTIPWGLEAVALGQLVASCVSFFINAHYSGRVLGFGVAAQLREHLRIAASAAVMAVVVLVSKAYLPLQVIPQLFALVAIGAIVYVGMAWLLGELSEAQMARLAGRRVDSTEKH